MAHEFKIDKKWYGKDIIFRKNKIILESGLTVLVGANGAGKSTLLQQIKERCKAEDIPCISFDNLAEGGRNARDAALWHGRTDWLCEAMISSEGENINMNIANFAGNLGNYIRKHINAKEIFVLCDAIDSGLSIDNIIETKKDLFEVAINDCKSRGQELYIIVSANAYELARGERCFDVNCCSYREFKTYNAYRNFIIKSRQKKDKRYKREVFEEIK